MVLPIVIAGHAIGIVAARRGAVVHGDRKIPLPERIASIYERARARLAIHPLSGVYVLLPLPGFIGAFLAASWVLALMLFAATGANPFIYFQF
jgi:hypothetical protein